MSEKEFLKTSISRAQRLCKYHKHEQYDKEIFHQLLSGVKLEEIKEKHNEPGNRYYFYFFPNVEITEGDGEIPELKKEDLDDKIAIAQRALNGGLRKNSG
jgi:hypothetical protein